MRTVDQMFEPVLTHELLRLARKDRNWVDWEYTGAVREGLYKEYKCCTFEDTWVHKFCRTGVDYFGMWGLSNWLADGPKLFAPTAEQCAAMERIEVNLGIEDYAQPYPALLVDLPLNRYAPFTSVLCFFPASHNIMILTLHSDDHLDDITTTVTTDKRPIETSLQRYDEDCAQNAAVAGLALRVALNSCLCLVNYGAVKEALYPKQLEADRALTTEQSERGAKARYRVRTALQVVRFAQEVELTDRRGHGRIDAPSSGREQSPHWRRGHWAMVPCGKGGQKRRRVLRRPCMVRADLFVGDTADTTTTYHS